MINYIVHDLDDSIIAESFYKQDCIDAFMQLHPLWAGDVNPFIYEVEVLFNQCPDNEYDGVLRLKHVNEQKWFLKQVCSTNKLYVLLFIGSLRIILNK